MIANPKTKPAIGGDAIHGPFYIDGHVHIYPCFGDEAVFDAAEANCAKFGPGIGVMCMVEVNPFQVFARWRDEGRVGKWRLANHGEPEVLFAERDGQVRLIVLAGRQIVTKRRLGVLAIGTDRQFKDRKPIEESIGDARESGATTIVSFGIGKWHGVRGRIVDAIIEQAVPGELGIGDIGARPLVGKTPRQFTAAIEKGLTILPGSDPLIIRACEDDPCCYTARIHGTIRRATAGRELRQAIAAIGPHPDRCGEHVSLGRAVYQQVAMRVARKVRRMKGLDS